MSSCNRCHPSHIFLFSPDSKVLSDTLIPSQHTFYNPSDVPPRTPGPTKRDVHSVVPPCLPLAPWLHYHYVPKCPAPGEHGISFRISPLNRPNAKTFHHLNALDAVNNTKHFRNLDRHQQLARDLRNTGRIVHTPLYTIHTAM